MFRTPFGYLPGVAVHANILNSILQNDHLPKPGLLSASICTALLVMYALYLSKQKQSWKIRFVFFLSLLLFVVLSCVLFCYFRIAILMYTPLVVALVAYNTIDFFGVWEIKKIKRKNKETRSRYPRLKEFLKKAEKILRRHR
jgi:CHASE2 domain-containing sensor protein